MVAGIVAVSAVLPDYVHPQSEITDALVEGLAGDDKTAAVIRRIHNATGVTTRHLVMPIAEYRAIKDFTQANQLFRIHGLPPIERAARQALAEARVKAEDVDFLFFTTVTGVGAPSLDVELIRAMGFRSDIKRIPSFGLACEALGLFPTGSEKHKSGGCYWWGMLQVMSMRSPVKVYALVSPKPKKPSGLLPPTAQKLIPVAGAL